MLENNAKGWHGSYSIAGRNSAEKFHIIVHKDSILSETHKKLHIKDIFTPNSVPKLYSLEDNIDVFKVYSSEANEKRMQSQLNPDLKKSEEIGKYKYHNKTVKDFKRKSHKPPLVRYYPNYEFIWKRTLTGPGWQKLKGRARQKGEIDDKEFYISHKPIALTGKSFISMNKQTKRGDFIDMNKDVRIRTDKSFEQHKHLPTLTNIENERKPNYSQEMQRTDNSNSKDKEKNLSICQASTKQTEINLNTTGNQSKIININSRKQKVPLPPQKKERNNAPDFKKLISRDQVEKIKGEKKSNPCYRQPNYSLTRQRQLTMVSYDRIQHKTNWNRQMKGMDPSMTFDPDKILDKVNNHSQPTAPNFKQMTSRPNGDGTLPSYMQRMYNRAAVYILTDKSLKQNNYSQAKFMSATSSFWPKKSYNRLINLNLLQSEKYKNAMKDDMKEAGNFGRNFYQTNFDQILKEGELNRFDNITLKTNHREHKIDPNDMEKFLVNFDNVDA